METPPTAASADQDVSDAQFEAYFESGGNEPSLAIADDGGAAETPAEPPASTGEASNESEQPGHAETDNEHGELHDAGSADGAGETEQSEPQKLVPLAALHEERERRKELRLSMDRMEERFQQILQKIQAPPTPPAAEPPVPDLNEDPAGNLHQRLQAAERALQEYAEKERLTAEQDAQLEQQRRLIGYYKGQAAEFKTENADFDDAYDHWVASRKADFEAAGYGPDEADGIINQEEMALVMRAAQQGKNPAGFVYAQAKLRGYTGPKPAESPPETPPPNAAEKLEVVAAGQEATSLLQGGGQTPPGDTLEALAAIEDDAEFAAAFDKLAAKQAG